MAGRKWLITGISSGFGQEIAKKVLADNDIVYGTARNMKKIEELRAAYPKTLFTASLDVTDLPKVHEVVADAFEKLGEIDVVVSNAGYGLYGAAEEISDEEADLQIRTNLTGAIAFIRSTLPYLRRQKHGRIVQIASVAGQVGYLGNSLYNATKFGITGYCEALSLEMKPFGVGVTIVEPGGARTDFRYGGAKTAANLMDDYAHAHGFLDMLDASKGLAPGDPSLMADRIIESTMMEPAPKHLALGSKALGEIIDDLETRLSNYKAQKETAASTDCI
ncbi:MAG: SDR family NAD(P)-dependent oxidoreductase [Mogibacterium sp.]|nr:SDR family NAD(P)-dependent oxidoreductase [Mogibacterium sp.]